MTRGNAAVSGTVDAISADDAARLLALLDLRVTRMESAAPPARSARQAFSPDDFLAFNQQLAHLTGGGLPVERGLRLMAGEMRTGRQRKAVDAVAAELEKGTPVGEAFAAHRRQFPPLYGLLVDAGVRANDLPAILLNLGRHLTLVGRLRATLWRSMAYPFVVCSALLLVLAFIWFRIIPATMPLMSGKDATSMFAPRHWSWNAPGTPDPEPPIVYLLPVAMWTSYALMAALAIGLSATVVIVVASRFTGGWRRLEPLLLRVPLVGPVLKWNLLARWCDGVHLGISSGLDLPESIELASDVASSRGLATDGRSLVEALGSGRAMTDAVAFRMMPPLVPAMLQSGSERSDLVAATASLAQMYQEQAEVRLAVLPAVLSPLMLVVTAVGVGLAIVSALAPMIMALSWLNR